MVGVALSHLVVDLGLDGRRVNAAVNWSAQGQLARVATWLGVARVGEMLRTDDGPLIHRGERQQQSRSIRTGRFGPAAADRNRN